jgi:GAF domain-containing protein
MTGASGRFGALALSWARMAVPAGLELEALRERVAALEREVTAHRLDLQARERDLAEALEREAAVREVLERLRGSTFDLPALLETLVEHATRLCRAESGLIYGREGTAYRMTAGYGIPAALRAVEERTLIVAGRATVAGRVALEPRVHHVPDVAADPEYRWPEGQRAGGYRTLVGVPLLGQGGLIGMMVIYRTRVEPFTERQIALVTTFADQAVIAIEGVRQLRELEARTRELARSVDELQALGEVSRAVSSSLDLRQVLDTIVRHAVRLAGGAAGAVFEFDATPGVFRGLASHGLNAAFLAALETTPVDPNRGVLKRAVETGRSFQIADIKGALDFVFRDLTLAAGFQALLAVPLVGQTAIRGVVVYRWTPGGFEERLVTLLEALASHAAVAVDNAGLFRALQDRSRELAHALEEQLGLEEVSQAVNSSLELETVLATIVRRAVTLSASDGGAIYELDEPTQRLELRAPYGMSEEFLAAVRRTPLHLGDALAGRAAASRRPEQIPDILAEPFTGAIAELGQITARAGFRALLAVPLLREDRILGLLMVRRRAPGRFAPGTIDLLQRFATQSGLAIQNARLFREIAEWNRTLEERVREQVAQLDRLGRLKRFFSPQLAELIVAGGADDPLRTHRRDITVVFLDLRGFTPFAETAEPEEVMGVLGDYHAAMGRLILEHEGTLERFTGDGMMVFFNDPVPVANPAERALRMAVAMRDRVRELTVAWRKRGHDLALGVGIAEGYATIGAIGFEGRRDYAAIGTVTNLAARLCGEARAGQILVSSRVAAAVEQLIELEPVGALTLKGLVRPVEVFNVVRAKGTAKGDRLTGPDVHRSGGSPVST